MTIQELLPLYAMGLLEGDEATMVENAIAADPALQRELDSFDDVLVTPVAPDPDLEAQLLGAIGGGRFEKFAAKMAALVDLSIDRTRQLLGMTERKAHWGEEAPRVFLIHFDAGPSLATADCGLIRIAPGGVFPPHMHLGEEQSLVLQGRLRDSDGKVYGPGDEFVYAQGTSHLLTVDGDEDVIFVARALNGIELQLPPQA
ncbi:MAG: cupin domain-containing protein [Kofleriaceae bacterium]